MPLSQTARERLETLARDRRLQTNLNSDSPWENAAKTIVNEHAMVIQVRSEDDLKAIYKLIHTLSADNQQQIITRAVGGLHDERGLFKEGCCYGFGGFLNRANPVSKQSLKSYSYAPKTNADVIIEFSEKFYKQGASIKTENKGTDSESSSVIIPAGMTFTQILKKLAAKGLTLPQVPSICDRSVVGTVVNGVEGIEKYAKHIWYIDANGEEQELDSSDPKFNEIIVKFRLFGLITKIEMAAVPNVKLKQQVGWAGSIAELREGFKLGGSTTTLEDVFSQHENVRLNLIPTYRSMPSANDTRVDIKNIEVIAEDTTTESRTKDKGDTLADEIFEYFGKKALNHGREKIYDLFYQKDLDHLVRAYQMLVAALHHAQRGEETLVKYRSELSGMKVKHPIDMLKSCMYIPVKRAEVEQHIREILSTANQQLIDNYKQYGSTPLTPINFISVKLVNGSSADLSATKAKEGEVVIAVEFNGNRHAEGYDNFLANLYDKLKAENYTINFDLSKLMPSGSVYFSASKEGSAKVLDYLKQANGEDGIGTSPFVAPVYASLLADVASANSLDDVTEVMPELQVQPDMPHSVDDMIEFLQNALTMAVEITKHFVKNSPEVTAALGLFEDLVQQAIQLYEQKKSQAESLPEAENIMMI